MDDGAAEGKRLRLNTQSFSAEEAAELAGLIRAKFGIIMTINMDKNRPRLRCSAASMERLVHLVRPHTLPSMLYKLSL
jgi:LAGLIDADG DNA endonuclease family protein